MSDESAAPLAGIDPVHLLPARRAQEAERMALPLAVVGSAAFDAGHGVAVLRDARGVSYGIPWVIDGRDRAVRRARAGDGAADALVAAIVSGTDASDALDVTVLHAEAAQGERAVEVDQTNDLVIVGDRAVVKWALHPEAWGAPGPDRLRMLADAGFEGTPRTWAIVHLVAGTERLLVATVSEYLPGALDGWDWAVEEVRALARGGTTDIDDAVPAVARLVADLHCAFARAGVRPASAEESSAWLAGAQADAEAAGLDPETADRVARVLAPIAGSTGAPIIPVHGDLHIGQVLRTEAPRRYLVIDFDGNPMLDRDGRHAWQPAARDVAGMLASLDHVGRVVLHRTEGLDEVARERVLAWIERAQQQFLATYLDALTDAGRTDLLDARVLTAMQVQQECREYAYADRYLPHWRYVPDAALPALLDRSLPAEA